MAGNNKRPLSGDEEPMETGDEKRHATHGEEIIYKVLCASSRTGAVIGKGGEVINRLRSESGAKIRVEDFVPGCEERVIFISAEDTPDEDECPAQIALHAVIETVLGQDDAALSDDENVTVRLLAHISQVGGIIGKGGESINELRSSTGASIRVLPKQDLPLCAPRNDEVCQISGSLAQVRQAVAAVGAKLRANPVKEKTPRAAQSQPPHGAAYGGASPMMMGRSPMSRMTPPPHMEGGVEITYRFLVPSSKAGSIIGRGGDVIRRIREETGAKVKLQDAVENCEWRVVSMTSTEDALSPFCGAQEALLRCFYASSEDQVGTSTAKLLVAPNFVGAVLGKGGAIITSLRQDTGASIRVVGKETRDEIPMCADAEDEMIVVEGHAYSVDAALRGVTLRLRTQAMRNEAPTGHNTATHGGVHARAPAALDPAQTSKVVMRIAADQVGGIIGKGGANIMQIRQISGANVRLKDADGSGDRELEIVGSEQECQSANNLVQAFLWKNATA